MQRATCHVLVTACNVQHATYSLQRARCNVQRAGRSGQGPRWQSAAADGGAPAQVNAEAVEALLACAGLILPGNLKRSAAALQRADGGAAPLRRPSFPFRWRKLLPGNFRRCAARHAPAAHARATKRATCRGMLCAALRGDGSTHRAARSEASRHPRDAAGRSRKRRCNIWPTRHSGMRHGTAVLQPPRGAAERADDRAREEAPAHRDWCATSVLHLSRAPIQTRSHIAVLPPIAIGARQAPAPMHAHAPARACARKLGRSHAHAHRRPHQSTSRLAQTARSPTS